MPAKSKVRTKTKTVKKKARATPAKPPLTTHVQPTHVSITFKIVTPDQRRRIVFTLSRTSDADNDRWSILFQLDERSDETQDFQLVIQLQVQVDHEDDSNAAATAKHGLDSDQHAQALMAASTAKDVKTGAATAADANDDAARIVRARNAASPK